MYKSVWLRYILIGACILLFVPVFIETLNFLSTNGNTDLKCRAIASRVQAAGKDPYFYKWNPADGEYLLDPNDNPRIDVNGNVVTPAMLWLLLPIHALHFETTQLVFFAIQYLAMAGIFFFLFLNYKRSAILPFAIVFISLICSNIWVMHVERGQVYILFTLFFTICWWLYTQQATRYIFLSGFLAGLTIFFRPFAMVLGAGFVLSWKKHWIYGMITGVLFGLLIFVAPKPSTWQQYLTAMTTYQHLQMNPGANVANPVFNEIPKVVEGKSNYNIATQFQVHSFTGINQYATRFHFPYTPAISMLVYGLTCLSLIALFLWRQRRYPFSINQIFLFGLLLYFLTEYIIISPRSAYNAIQWIFPAFLIIQSRLTDTKLVILTTLSLLLLNGAILNHSRIAGLGEPMLLVILCYATFTREPLNPNAKWEKPQSILPAQS